MNKNIVDHGIEFSVDSHHRSLSHVHRHVTRSHAKHISALSNKHQLVHDWCKIEKTTSLFWNLNCNSRSTTSTTMSNRRLKAKMVTSAKNDYINQWSHSQQNLEVMEVLAKLGGSELHVFRTPWHQCDVSWHLYDLEKLMSSLFRIILQDPSRIEGQHLNV